MLLITAMTNNVRTESQSVQESESVSLQQTESQSVQPETTTETTASASNYGICCIY